ncbi:sugar ABC transporter substrate-binding protein, partial [Mesorhizobium sp. M7A.F.Ca.AU.002.06.1.1]
MISDDRQSSSIGTDKCAVLVKKMGIKVSDSERLGSVANRVGGTMSFLSKLKSALVGAAAAAFLSTAALAADEPTVGVVVPTLDAQFWNSYVAFMKKGADELGVKLVVLNADNKPDQMVKSLEDLVAQKVDGIVFTPYWATA